MWDLLGVVLGGDEGLAASDVPGDEGVVRSTVDLPRSVNRALRRMALDHDTSLQVILGTLAAAVAEDDPRAIALLGNAVPGLRPSTG